MIEKYSIRTDLALEDKERFESDNVEVQGVSLKEDYDEEREIKVTTVKIETENGAKVMRKPVGTYITMEAPNMAVPDEDYHDEISKELAKFLARFIKKDKEDFSILVVGLGNRKVTPDALGPYVVDNLNTVDSERIRQIRHGRRECPSGECDCSRRHGPDRNGDGRDYQGNRQRDEAGSDDCCGCVGSEKLQTSK